MPAIANTLIVDNTFTIDNNTIDVSQADLTFSIDAGHIVDVSGTGALRIPSGTTGERPVSNLAVGSEKYVGSIRYNTSSDNSGVEIFNTDKTWVPLGSGGFGSSNTGGSVGDFNFDTNTMAVPSGDMNITSIGGNINLEAYNNITIRANNSAIDLSAENVYGGIPIGGIILWSGKQSASSPFPKVPAGWWLCDGTNNTPDLRGRFVVGYSNSEPFNAIDASGGEKEHTLTVDEMPSHGHSITDPGHVHIETMSSYTVNHIGQGAIYLTHGGGTDVPDAYKTTQSATTGITIDPSGGGQPHNNLPPYYVLAYIMRIR
jgi:microcystin-dependent protein